MPDSVVVVVEVAALALAVYAAVRSLPRPQVLPWTRVFDGALVAAAGRASDAELAELDALGSLASVTGPGVGWGSVESWPSDLREGLGRRFRDVVFADIGSGQAPAMSAEVPGVRGTSLASAEDLDDAELAGQLLDLVQKPSDRLVLVVSRGESPRLLRALALAPALRDRLVAVVAIGESLRGEIRPDWLDENFSHEAFDTELNRATPWISVADAGHDAARQRWPDPPVPESGRRSIDPIALGPVALGELERSTLYHALWLLLAFRLHD